MVHTFVVVIRWIDFAEPYGQFFFVDIWRNRDEAEQPREEACEVETYTHFEAPALENERCVAIL